MRDLANLLTDGVHLTGVIDWEFAGSSAAPMDLLRLQHYEECARAYEDEDDTYEGEVLERLFHAIPRPDAAMYRVARAAFYLRALAWAARSSEPDRNVRELESQWGKYE